MIEDASELVAFWGVFDTVFRWYRAEAKMRVRGLNRGGVVWFGRESEEVLDCCCAGGFKAKPGGVCTRGYFTCLYISIG